MNPPDANAAILEALRYVLQLGLRNLPDSDAIDEARLDPLLELPVVRARARPSADRSSLIIAARDAIRDALQQLKRPSAMRSRATLLLPQHRARTIDVLWGIDEDSAEKTLSKRIEDLSGAGDSSTFRKNVQRPLLRAVAARLTAPSQPAPGEELEAIDEVLDLLEELRFIRQQREFLIASRHPEATEEVERPFREILAALLLDICSDPAPTHLALVEELHKAYGLERHRQGLDPIAMWQHWRSPVDPEVLNFEDKAIYEAVYLGGMISAREVSALRVAVDVANGELASFMQHLEASEAGRRALATWYDFTDSARFRAHQAQLHALAAFVVHDRAIVEPLPPEFAEPIAELLSPDIDSQVDELIQRIKDEKGLA